MRMIGQLSAEADARRFVDYLLTRSVAAHAEESQSGAWQIWIEHDDHLDAGLAELKQFEANPADPRFDSAADAAAIRKQEQKAAEKRRQNFHDVRTTTFAPLNNAVPATFIIIGIAVAVFVFGNFGGAKTASLMHYLLFADPTTEPAPAFDNRWVMFKDVGIGQVWRLVTPAFLHGGFLHIIFNMMWMLDLGRRIEPVRGSARFVGLVIAIALISNLAEAGWTAVSPWEPGHFSVFLGMSGVVSGLFGYAWMCGRYRPYERIFVSQHELGYMIGWLVICSFGIVGPIANAAHWGGLVIGMLIGLAPTLARRFR